MKEFITTSPAPQFWTTKQITFSDNEIKLK